MGVAEIFSLLLENLAKNRLYLQSIGIEDKKILDALDRRNKFMELFFVTFYSANAIMKTPYWQNGFSAEQARSAYSKLLKHYVGLEIPGQYCMLHHILPDSIMYVPSYLIAAVRATELEIHIKQKFGARWWAEEQAGRYLRTIMKPGASVLLSEFSCLDFRLYLEQLGV